MYELGRRAVHTNSIEIERRWFIAVVVMIFTVGYIVDVVLVDDIVIRLKMNKIIADSKA